MDCNFSRVNLKLPNEVKEWIREEAERNGASMQSYISIVLTQYVQSQMSSRALSQLGSLTTDLGSDEFQLINKQNNDMLKTMQELMGTQV